MYLHEISIIHDRVDDLMHVVRFIRICRHKVVEFIIHAGDVIGALYERRLLHVILRDEAYQTTYFRDRLFFGCRYEMRHTGLRSVDLRTTELLYRHVFTGDSLDNFRSCDEHITVLLGHEDEVGQRRAVHCSTRARAEDNTDLRYDTGSQNITLEDLCITCQRTRSFLDTRTTGVIKSNDRSTEFHGLVHDITDLLRHGLRK